METLPLTEPVLLVLLSLAEQPRHGYSILKDVKHMSAGRVVLSTGTLYGALQRLLSQGWIERLEEQDGTRHRRCYRLTSKGRRNLECEVDRMRQLTKLAGLRIAGGRPDLMLRAYRSLLYLYPAAYRREFGEEMSTVFLQAQRELANRRLVTRVVFGVREMSGLLAAAVGNRLRQLFGLDDWLPFRRFAMRPEFKFLRFTVFLMCIILAGVALAIDKAKTVQLTYGAAHAMSGWGAVDSLAFMMVLVCVAVAAGWGILFALRRTGLHRLAKVEPQPDAR
jgi:DNA-binding PadR family transcriptional regulator